MRIENLRTDIVSHKAYPKYQLIRLVKRDNKVVIDNAGNMSGRGIYILKDEKTIKKSLKPINHCLQTNENEGLIDVLLKQL